MTIGQNNKISEMLEHAESDSEPASLYLVGKSDQEIETCIMVLRGRDHVRWLREMLVRQKLLTEGKPIGPAVIPTKQKL